MKDVRLSYYKGIKDVSSPAYLISLEKCVERIKYGTTILKENIANIRSEKNKDRRNLLKTSLYCIIPAGEFSTRTDQGLKKHSGLMVMDFDHIKKDEIDAFKKELIKNKSVAVCFLSPSSDGLKAFIRIEPCDQEEHRRLFKAFLDEYNYPYTDRSNVNPSRVCYESFDPDIYVNFKAEVYTSTKLAEGYSYTEREAVLPVTDDNEKIRRIMAFNWKKDFVEGERNAFIFDLSGMLCEYGVDKTQAEGYIINNVVIGDFSEREVLTTIRSAYKSRSFGIKYFEDKQKESVIRRDLCLSREVVMKKHAIDEETYIKIKDEHEHANYWIIKEEKGGRRVKIDPYNFKLFLEQSGFKKYYPYSALKSQFVRIQENKVSDTSKEVIKDFVLNDLLVRGETMVWNYFSSYPGAFSEDFLQMLDTIELDILRDTATTAYFAYKNGVLEVTKDATNFVSYLDLNKYIWASHIIDRNYVATTNEKNHFKTFINNVSNGNPRPIEVSIGYMLHTYKNLSNNKALIVNDAIISDTPEGGTGKGLIFQGISQMRRVEVLNGKQHDDKNRFSYQTVPLDVQVLVFDDVKKNFDFESQFSVITEGIILERKNKDAIKLTVNDSPKIGITTNYAIKGSGNSHTRRRHEIELQQYYNGNRTPYDEFGCHLFVEWSDKDFIPFDAYMIQCLQMYMTFGLVKQESENIKLRQFISSTNSDFYEWVSNTANVPLNKRCNKKKKFLLFIEEYSDYAKYRQKTFTIWIELYAKLIEGRYTQGSSNGNHWFAIEKDGVADDLGNIDPF